MCLMLFKKHHSVMAYLLIISLKIVSLNSKECNHIKNVKVYVNFALFSPLVRHKDSYEKNIQGCLEEGKFLTNLSTRIGINCTGTEITALEEHSVRQMEHLKSVDIYSCPIERIEPQAFVNVPKLEWVLLINGSIKVIQRGIFDVLPNLKQIIIRGHEIEYVEDYAFSNIPTLKLIDLSHNNLRYLSSNWFTNSTGMNQVYLSFNFITRIRQDAFQYGQNLQYLWMAHNKISTIDAGAFNGLSEILYLDLGQNLLTTISPDMFPKNLPVSYVDLERNLLNYIPLAFLERIQWYQDGGGGVKIVGNPIKCQCLDVIHRWMYERKLKSRLIVWTYADVKNCQKPYTLPVCGVTHINSINCADSVDTELTERYIQILEKNLPLTCIENA